MTKENWEQYTAAPKTDWDQYTRPPEDSQQNPFISGVRNFNNTMSSIPQTLLQSGLFGDALKRGSQQFGQEQQQLADQGKQQNPASANFGQNLGRGGNTFLGFLAARLGLSPVAAAGGKALSNKTGNALEEAVSSQTAKHGRGPDLEEMLANYEASRGTGTPLGRVLESPGLAHFHENVTSKIPLSGGAQGQLNVAGQVTKKGEDLLSKTLGANAPKGDLNEVVKDVLQQRKEYQRVRKEELFDPVNRMAEKENLIIEIPKTQKIIKDSIKFLEESALYQGNDKVRNAINKLKGYVLEEQKPNTIEESAILNEKGVPFSTEIAGEAPKAPSIVESRVIADALEEAGEQVIKNPLSLDQSLGKKLIEIANQLRKEVYDNINSKGSPELKAADSKAMANYKKEYAPFLDKEVHKLLSENLSGENFVRKVIKPGKELDQAETINKIQQLFAPEDRNMLAFSYLSKALSEEGKLNPNKLYSMLNGLGKRQFEALFPNKSTQKEVKEFMRLMKLNPEAMHLMFNPKTGHRNSFMSWLTDAGLAKIPVSKSFNKYMVSEEFRDAVMRKIIENASKENAKADPEVQKMLEQALQGM